MSRYTLTCPAGWGPEISDTPLDIEDRFGFLDADDPSSSPLHPAAHCANITNVRVSRLPSVILLIAAIGLNAQDPGDTAFDYRADAGFGDPSAGLREFLRTRHVRKTQHFCAVGYRDSSGGNKRAWIIWAEGRKILDWTGSSDPAFATHSVARSRVIDLERDVVATEAGLKGSTYLVTRAWVSSLQTDCKARGVQYEVRVK